MAGTLAINNIQLGDSATATQNFVLKTNVNGTATLARGNVGATTQDILTVDSTGKVTLTNGEVITISKLQSGTNQNSTSGTSIDFTGIPSWAKRITVMFNEVSTSGTSPFKLQLGTSGGIENTGYLGASSAVANTNITGAGASSTSGIDHYAIVAAASYRGYAILTMVANQVWLVNWHTSSSEPRTFYASGTKALSGVLDRVRITTVNGTDTFDAGSINIMWE